MQVFRLFICLLGMHVTHASLELGALKDELTTPKVRIFLGSDSVRQKNFEHLKREQADLEQKIKDFQNVFDQKMADLVTYKNIVQDKQISKNSVVIQKQLALLSKFEQLLFQIKEIKDKTLELLMTHIDFWDRYFNSLTHQIKVIEEKSLYGFIDFQNMIMKLFMAQDQLEQLLIQKEALRIVIGREEHLIASKSKELNQIQSKIHECKKQNEMNKEEIFTLDLEKEVVSKEQEFATLQLAFYQKQFEFFAGKETVAQERLAQLQDQSKFIRARLYIDLSDVQQYEQKFAQERQASIAKRTELTALRHQVAAKKLQGQEELDRLRARFKIKMVTLKEMADLEFQSHSNSENVANFSVANAYAAVVAHDRQLTKIKIEMILVEVKEKQAQIMSDMVKLLYEISQGYVKDSYTFEKEKALYKQYKDKLTVDIKNFKDENIVLQNNIKELQKILSHILAQQEKAKNNPPSGAGSAHKKWSDTIVLLEQLIGHLQQQHEMLLASLELHEKIIVLEQEMLESVDTILHEFNTVGVWHRSMSAVTWEGVKNIVPNLFTFVKDVYNIISMYLRSLTFYKIVHALGWCGLVGCLKFLFILFLLLFLYLLLQNFLPSLYKNILKIKHDDTDLLYRSRQVFAILLGFFIEIFTPLYMWILGLSYELLFNVPVGLLILFYIFSIVLWIYASKRLLIHFICINRKFDYSLLSKRLIERFSKVFSFFAISTIVILILRKMFIVVMAHEQTELPNILLRVYHIVIFLSIIFSLDKEELIHILPKKTSFGQRFTQLLDRHYYLFLITIFSLLVLSDPYLGGYGTIIWHFCWNLFLTVGVFATLFILHTLIKQYSTYLFFSPSEMVTSGVSERFEHAKTWYAMYVIGLMLLFVTCAIILWAEIWGYGFSFLTLKKIIMYELVKFETVNNLGKPESFRVVNLFYIIIMTVLGVVLAYLFKRFVLQRVFDIQYVDPGIQNTLTIISRYVIISMAIMIACIQSKLGFVVTYVSFVGLATFGWSFKDLFTDFVAYFFILVQRPLKLGDYVRIDDDTMGVVRRISPRAVILRRKNAVNIVVPNSTILKSSLYNWNYSRSYIGLDDIIFCVPFGTNIELVRDICFKILDENHDVLKVPQPFVRLQDFSDKGYVFMVRGFLSSGNTLRQWDIASNIRFALVLELAKVGIPIAGPSIKIMMKKDFDHSLL